MKLLISLLLCLFIGECTFGAILPEISWTNRLNFESGFQAKWSINDPEWLVMEISAPTNGWVSCGLSPNGGMAGSDIIMGWVDAMGEAHIKDLYAVGNSSPLVDDSQDYVLLSGEERNGRTTIRFKRKWNSCDTEHDNKITEDTTKLLWAIGQHDPDPIDFSPHYHGSNRGVQNVYLKAEGTNTMFPADDNNLGHNVGYFDVAVKDHPVSSATTTYSCFLMKYPDLGKKRHMIGWRPIIQKENKPRVHHFVVFECVVPGGDTHSVFREHLGKVETCYNPNMPPSWATYCWTVPIVWTLGQEGEMYPEHLGIPIGEEHGGATYFMFEVHYDNPEEIEFVDSSGIRIYHTDQLRENDLTSATIGTRFSSFLFVPPGADSYHVVGGCTAECTEKALPEEGVKATHVVLHAHKAAHKVILRHIRNGKELPPIAIDNNYDLNYQQARTITPERQILPGDQLLTYCEYNSTHRKQPLYGDLTTEDSEMCHSFLFYYPKVDTFASCQWQSEFKGFLKALEVEKVEGKVLDIVGLPYMPKQHELLEPHDEGMLLLLQNMSMNSFEYMNVVKPAKYRGKTVKDIIDTRPWQANHGGLANEFENKVLNGDYYAICTGKGRSRIPLDNYITRLPDFEEYKEEQDATCKGSITNTQGTFIMVISALTLFWSKFV